MPTPLKATTAHDARREIAQRWPDRDVNYRGFTADGVCVIGGLVRRKGQSSGRLGGKPKKPGPHSPIRFEAEI
jgi:hypothetical protein